MSARLLPLLGLVALALVGGCSSATEDEEAGEGSAAVINGQSSGDRAIMLLTWTAGEDGGVCSSVLIAPDVLLTVAHCVVDAPRNAKFAATADNLVEFSKMERARFFSITRVERHPDYDTKHPELGHDLAIAFLKRPMDGVTPAKLSNFQLPASWVDTTAHPVQARIVGYGINSDRADPHASGRRRELRVPLRSLASQTILIGDGTAGQACLNDSGGPALVTFKGQELVVSVASFMRGKTCTTGNNGTRLDVNWPFMKSVLGSRIPDLAPTPVDFPGNVVTNNDKIASVGLGL